MEKDVKFIINRLLYTLDSMKARLLRTKNMLELGETVTAEIMQYVMDSDLTHLIRQYQQLIKMLGE